MFPDPIVQEHEGIYVVRDDLIPGGTKRRIIQPILHKSWYDEFAYPSTAFGAAMVALAYAAKETNKKVNIFLAERKKGTPFIDEMCAAGDNVVIHPVRGGLYRIVQAAAKKYCEANPKIQLIPCGLNYPDAVNLLSKEVNKVKKQHGQFDIVMSACSSGALQSALQIADIGKEYIAVGTGMKNPEHGKAQLIEHYLKEKFEKETKILPPYPTVRNYDGKVWQYAVELRDRYPEKKILVWNVACTKDDLKRV